MIEAAEAAQRFIAGRQRADLDRPDEGEEQHHAYFEIDPAILWRTATEEIPALLPPLRAAVKD